MQFVGFFIAVLFFTSALNAQFSDSFNDGDFSTNPVWTGYSSHFQITPDFQLQLNAPPVTATSHLVTACQAIGNAQFDFFVKLDFNPSTSNLARVYLAASDSNLSGPLNGYFVQIGGTTGVIDDVSLYYQSGTTKTKIIDGKDSTAAISPKLNIRVTRDMLGNWELYIDTALNGNWVSQGAVFHNQTTNSAYFGVFCKYTSTRSDKFFFDNFIVTGGPVVDITPPVIDSVIATSLTEIKVFFNEPIEPQTAQDNGNYLISGGIGIPQTAWIDTSNQRLVHLLTPTSLPNNQSLNLKVSNVKDLAGNIMSTQNVSFYVYIPQESKFGDIIINEIFADPNPTNGLPEAEFIELTNTTQYPINLNLWSYSDANTSVSLPSYIIQPNTYLILCDEADTSLFSTYGQVLGLSSWPTLNNSGDNLVLRDAFNHIIDEVPYKSSWYNNHSKAAGGWSLERISPFPICNIVDNWSASLNTDGGTPGKINSIFDTNKVTFQIVSATVISDNEIEILFSSAPDPVTTSTNNFSIHPKSCNIVGALFNSENQNAVILTVLPDLEANVIYQVTTNQLTDCFGSSLAVNPTIMVKLPQHQDLLINEVLFNPKLGGSDYIELYNTSSLEVNIHNWSLLYFNNSGDSAFKTITEEIIVKPGQLIVLTEDSTNVKDEYPLHGTGCYVEMDLPTYANSEGSVILLNQLKQMDDKLIYSEDMHLEIITDPDGVSLERINYNLGPNSSNNWHSASSAVGYGTPGVRNSQYLEIKGSPEPLSVSPSTFSPNNDGFKDVVAISYQFSKPNNIATIQIYTANGQLINTLVNNQTIGTTGSFYWEGNNDNGEIMPTGMYIVMMRVFDLNNNQNVYKKVVVLAQP